MDSHSHSESAIHAEASRKHFARIDAIVHCLQNIDREAENLKGKALLIGLRQKAVEHEYALDRQVRRAQWEAAKQERNNGEPSVYGDDGDLFYSDELDDEFSDRPWELSMKSLIISPHLREEFGQLEESAYEISLRRKDLVQKRSALVRESTALEAGLPTEHSYNHAPIRRVPVEILAEIFVSVMDSSVHRVGGGTGSVLAQVDRKWRAVACDLSQLWSSFGFELFGNASETSLLEIYLDRSGNAPLVVHVDSEGGRQGANVELAMALLGEHAHRMHTLRITHPPGAMDFDFLRGKLARLEVLELGGNWMRHSNAFADAPRLHTLSLLDERTPDLVPVPGHQIRTIYFASGVTPHSVTGRYPNLTSLVLPPPVGDNGQGVPSSTTFLRLEYLRLPSLRLQNESMEYLDKYITPSLRRLDLSLFQHPGFSAPRLCAFLLRSRCDLTHLEMKECFIRPRDLLEIFPLLPTLRTLAIQHASSNTLTNSLMDSLSISPGHLPQLTTLHIDGSYPFLRTESLLTMLESRTASLQNLEIILRDRELGEPSLTRFRNLQLDLNLFCLDAERKMHRVSGDLALPAIPSPENDPSPRGFLT
ncbi:hypothetical protein C8R43DRAFT_1235723 [Mycena crocata]|nr:hypothetical protein C8R43DRAFT_1235723 [Mycena crocata]